MTKFKFSVELQGYKVELGSVKVSVEGDKEDAPRIAQQIEKQLSEMVQAPAIMAPTALTAGNGHSRPPVINGAIVESGGNVTGKKKAKRLGVSGTKTPAQEISFVHNPAKYATPQMNWSTGQKAIWFLYVVNEQANISELTAYNIAKNFNKYFKASKPINSGNVMTALDKEKQKGSNSTVATNVSDGTTKYFLTQAGITVAQKLANGEDVTSE